MNLKLLRERYRSAEAIGLKTLTLTVREVGQLLALAEQTKGSVQ